MCPLKSPIALLILWLPQSPHRELLRDTSYASKYPKHLPWQSVVPFAKRCLFNSKRKPPLSVPSQRRFMVTLWKKAENMGSKGSTEGPLHA